MAGTGIFSNTVASPYVTPNLYSQSGYGATIGMGGSNTPVPTPEVATMIAALRANPTYAQHLPILTGTLGEKAGLVTPDAIQAFKGWVDKGAPRLAGGSFFDMVKEMAQVAGPFAAAIGGAAALSSTAWGANALNVGASGADYGVAPVTNGGMSMVSASGAPYSSTAALQPAATQASLVNSIAPASAFADAGGDFFATNAAGTNWEAFKATLPTAVQTVLSGMSGSTLATIAGALMGATQGQPADITSSVTPWGPAQAGIQTGVKAAEDLLKTGGTFTPPTVPTAPQYGNTYTAPNVTAPTKYAPTLTDQYIQSAITGALKPLNDQYSTVTMPQIGTNSMGNGQFGSSRQAIAEALASNSLQQNSGALSAQLMNQFVQAQAANQLGTNQLNSTNTTNYNALLEQIQRALAVGQQSSNQLNSDNLWQNYGAQYKGASDSFTLPWNAMTAANNIFQNAGGTGRTMTTPMPETPWWQTAIAGGGAANEMYKKLFPGA